MPQTGVPNPTFGLSCMNKTAICGVIPHYETQTSGFVQELGHNNGRSSAEIHLKNQEHHIIAYIYDIMIYMIL